MELEYITINVIHAKEYYEFRDSKNELICTCDPGEIRDTMEEIKSEYPENVHITFYIKKL